MPSEGASLSLCWSWGAQGGAGAGVGHGQSPRASEMSLEEDGDDTARAQRHMTASFQAAAAFLAGQLGMQSPGPSTEGNKADGRIQSMRRGVLTGAWTDAVLPADPLPREEDTGPGHMISPRTGWAWTPPYQPPALSSLSGVHPSPLRASSCPRPASKPH